ncbi:acetyltransferase (GNAT) family protein [Terracoccus luteus]|uniref:Acetyltransferase (GNAT) family protein n=1 Tax=Terracoccus luteus TaxID=53356 RepID=A0A495XX31_9MICO|nr:acetyltransferase (GNAT) family protein [Terracoccus luteus]
MSPRLPAPAAAPLLSASPQPVPAHVDGTSTANVATVTRRDLEGPGDLRAAQAMSSRLWSPVSRFHPGQLAWNLATSVDRPPVSLWRDGEQAVALGWAESPDWLELQVDPDHPELADDVVEWFEDTSDAETQSALVMERDVSEPALAAAGFAPDLDAPWFTHHLLDLGGPGSLPTPPEVDGYRLRPVDLSRPGELERRAAVHADAWSSVGPSSVDAHAYDRVTSTWPYRSELDWVATTDDGELVASCLVWLDEAAADGAGVGLVEPVGCVPSHRGRGLATAVTLGALRRLRDLGARWAQVSPRGDPGHPGPQRLYRAMGFAPTARTVTWTRSLE